MTPWYPPTTKPAREGLYLRDYRGNEIGGWKFDYWMTHYNHKTDPENQKGHSGNKARLLEWLYADKGGELISTYAEFQEMAAKLADKGYNTNPAPSKNEFESALIKYQEKVMRDGRY